MKVIIPVAGHGTRLKPHTLSKPKSMIEVAGVPMINYIVEKVLSLEPDEVYIVTGDFGDLMKKYLIEHFPQVNFKFVRQQRKDGPAGAIKVALDKIEGEDELFVVFGHTLIDFKLERLEHMRVGADCIVFAKEVINSFKYTVLELRAGTDITAILEKPKDPKSAICAVGAYYFKSIGTVKKVLSEIYEIDDMINKEYKISQIIQRYIEISNVITKAFVVDEWFDCCNSEVLLDANMYFLNKMCSGRNSSMDSYVIISPSYVSKNAKIKNSIIGPYASIGDGSVVEGAIIKNSIISNNCNVRNINLSKTILSPDVNLEGKSYGLSLGENSSFYMD